MLCITALFLWSSCSFGLAINSSSEACSQKWTFPPSFKFGAATGAYQIEGAWNVSDKGECKWDRLTHKYPELFKNGANGDDAAKSYYYWRRDIEIAQELGLDFYRFSISWPRLLPNGLVNEISEDGKNYYNNLIDGLLEKGIEPAVSIYHWEMPQMLQDFGGWTNPMISDWFADYARVVFNLFGDRVKIWFTINEPIMECDMYHGSMIMEPQLNYNVGPFLCSKNILLAHAKAYRIYDQEFREKYGGDGKLTIANHLLWVKPSSAKYKDIAEFAIEYYTGRFTHPVYSKEGGWPKVVEETVANVSREQGFKESRLPAFTEEEIKLIRGTYDFFGMNHYTSRLIRPARPGEKLVTTIYGSIYEINATLFADPSWPYAKTKFMANYPPGIREHMEWIKKQYGDIEILITENGFGTTAPNIEDDDRIDYMKSYMKEVLVAMQEGIKVIGYTYWSMMDNFEWTDGYSNKFGLYQVDYSDPNRTRTPRKSARYYASVIKNRIL